jgi:hypothetical protein
VDCPFCAEPVPDGAARCPACKETLAGPDAAVPEPPAALTSYRRRLSSLGSLFFLGMGLFGLATLLGLLFVGFIGLFAKGESAREELAQMAAVALAPFAAMTVISFLAGVSVMRRRRRELGLIASVLYVGAGLALAAASVSAGGGPLTLLALTPAAIGAYGLALLLSPRWRDLADAEG